MNYVLQKGFERFGLGKALAKRASSVNEARHVANKKSRKRRALTSEERESEEKDAKKRLSSRKQMEEAYAQGQ